MALPTEAEKPQIIIRPTSAFATADQKQVQNAAVALPAIGEALAEPARQFWEGIQAKGSSPDEVEIAFSLALEGKTSWAIVSMGAEATISVTMKWSTETES